MQTNATKQNNWLQLLWWVGLYAFWVMVFNKRAFSFSRTATVEFCYLVFIAANFYFNVYYAIPKFLYRKKYAAFVGAMFSGIIVTALLRVPVATYLNGHFFLVGQPQPGSQELFVNSLLNIFIWTVCIVAGKLIIERFRFQQYVDEMAKAKEQAELDFLNAQFNPHFLFNSINSIYGHIDRSNTIARNMLLTFSDMLRYQLYDCNVPSINVEKEVNYIKNYIALQQARKGDNLVVSLTVADDVKGFSIAPLLFIAFIENAFKYVGNSDEKQNCVNISFQKDGNSLLFRCYNTKEAVNDNSIEHKGIGISNAKRRLALLYPDRHTLLIDEQENCYEVTLKLQLA